jgi:5-formyltetrahydrofolate cyclo-ligase
MHAIFFSFQIDPLDLVLLPGVAFTQTGNRLGHGMGFYDKYLDAYFKRHPNTDSHQTYLIGLAHREQIVDDNQLPTEATDWPLNCVIFPQ